MIISILLPIHRYGGLDILFDALERQAFPKNEYELILCDKLYKYRKHIVADWAKNNQINVVHFAPEEESEFHAHSSVLNECLTKAIGDCCIVIGDYSWFEPFFIERHHMYYLNGWCCSAPQYIYALPKLKSNLKQCYSTFDATFHTSIYKMLPKYDLDPKIKLPAIDVGHHFWHNRNESFPREKALMVGGWDESYNGLVGPSNKEFALRLKHEANCRIGNDPDNVVHRFLSYPIPPFTKFNAAESDDSINLKKYKELCQKYNVAE